MPTPMYNYMYTYACSFHVRTVHAHECTREAPRVGIDGPVNIRAVRLVD